MSKIFPLHFFIVIITAGVFCGCHIISDPEDLPAYIEVEDVEVFYLRPSETGVSTPNVTDVWILIDDDQHGVYHLPRIFPFLPRDRDRVKISARAGIRINGISATRAPYVFYTTWDTMVDINFFDTIKINPRVTYLENTIISWNADFETASSSAYFIPAPGSSIELERTQWSSAEQARRPFNGLYYGRGYGEPGSLMYLLLGSNNFRQNTFRGDPVFLEMEYDATESFQVNLRYTDPEGIFDENRVMLLNPTRSMNEEPVWNKIHIEFTDKLMDPFLNINKYGISIRGEAPSDSPAEFNFDNVKIVTR